jgi:hypothetical protein
LIRTIAALLSFALVGCGYRVGSRSDLLPPAIKTIAIPAFDNLTNRYKLSERLPGSIAREFITRTRYRIVSEPEQSDAVLRGAVVNIMTFPNVTDPTTGRSVGTQIIVVMNVSLTERQSGKVLFTRPAMEFRQRYEISVDQSVYLEESDVALDRLSRDVARTLVSSVLEAF